jgi:putative FmdB family regulatory protein
VREDQLMPTYVFACAACGRFEEGRPMARAGEPARCPVCRGVARRVFTPPGLPALAAPVRGALAAQEASAHEPRVVGRKQGRPMPHRPEPTPPWVLH